MLEATQRQIIIREIYERKAEEYADLRRLIGPRSMERRLHILEVMLAQERSGSRAHRLLEMERELVVKKHEIYTNSPNLPCVNGNPLRLLKLTDRRPEDPRLGKSESVRYRKAHTLILMHYLYIEKSFDELVAIRDARV